MIHGRGASKLRPTRIINTLTLAGRPRPSIRWLRSGLPLPAAYEASAGETVTSTVMLPALRRGDHGSVLTCEANNHEIARPRRKSVAITLKRE